MSAKLDKAEPEVIERAGSLIIKVLTGTRHKGALEAAALALTDLCSRLDDYPEQWLLSVLEQLERTGSSITRRSVT